jgi:hypothetical protein
MQDSTHISYRCISYGGAWRYIEGEHNHSGGYGDIAIIILIVALFLKPKKR